MGMQMTLRVTTNDRIGFRDTVKTIKEWGGRFDGTTKTWTIDTDRNSDAKANLSVRRNWTEYQDMSDEDIVRDSIRVGKSCEEVTK